VLWRRQSAPLSHLNYVMLAIPAFVPATRSVHRAAIGGKGHEAPRAIPEPAGCESRVEY